MHYALSESLAGIPGVKKSPVKRVASVTPIAKEHFEGRVKPDADGDADSVKAENLL